MAKHILISGGTGMLGGALTNALQDEGYEVAYLSRSKGLHDGIRKYRWDIDKAYIDPEALHWADAIIHLAGAGVADKRWSQKRKKVILESRTKSTRLLYNELKKDNYNIKHVISASAVGYYGFGGPDKVFKEDDPPGSDFLATVTEKWEEESKNISELKLKHTRLRIGVVLTQKGGAFKKLKQPIFYGIGSPLGSGKQMVSWIHLDDLINIFIHVMNKDLYGVYNAVAPEPVSNEKFTKVTARMMRRGVYLPNVPEFVLRLMFGEMADIILKGSVVSSEKIMRTGFKFKHPNISDAVYDILVRRV
ncbi:TIGR01777 family protein [Hyphobacterium sp. CCMP332]|nr:TIGR01777 family protein [Hyphobacterium sp. CCMP332]